MEKSKKLIKSLAMLKMEKNFIAVNDKNKPRYPYEHFTTSSLMDKLREETEELVTAICQAQAYESNLQLVEDAKKECADCSNVIDIIFERLCHRRLR